MDFHQVKMNQWHNIISSFFWKADENILAIFFHFKMSVELSQRTGKWFVKMLNILYIVIFFSSNM